MTSGAEHPYRFDHARTGVSIHAFRGEGDPTPRSPYRARAGPLARMVARAPQDVHAHRHDPRRRFAPFQSTPSGGKATPHREARTARAGPPARVVARAPTGVPARTDVTRRRRPERARSRPERARSQPEARTAPEAGQKRAPRQTPPGTRQEPATSSTASLLRLWTITDPV